MFGDWLFRTGDLGDYLRQQDAAIEPHIRQHVHKGDLVRTDEEIADQQLVQALVEPLKVDFEHPTKKVAERRINLPDGFGGWDEVDGVCATRAFSFTGDSSLFRLRPNQFSSGPRGEVRGNSVVVGAVGRNDPASLKQELDRQEAALREYVGNSNSQVASHNATLKSKIMEAVARRRRQLGELDKLKDLL